MKGSILWLVLLTTTLFTTALRAETLDSSTLISQEKRPRVAVVLAGGGAKGAAHIGVLKALEELRVPVDYLTGTSMGAWVGGLYASGLSADEIESFIYSVDWNTGYRDRVDRSERRTRDKEYEDRYQLTTDLGLKWGEVRTKSGVVQGQGMLKILRETSGNLPRLATFDQLVIPFRAVATDIIELEPVVLENGYLVDAMMASMSVPGALPPYDLNGQLLVDGGVTNNMPVDVAREMGAERVIAVDISSDYNQADDFTTLFTVADQLSNFLVRSTTQRQTELLGDGDILLQPDVGDMQTTEFDRMAHAYQVGYQQAMRQREQLESFSLSAAEYQRYVEQKQQARRQLISGEQLLIDQIVINNNSHYSDDLLLNRLDLKAGQQYSTQELEKRVRDLYALDRFELITYRFSQSEGKNLLLVDVDEKSWGPNYVNFRFFLEDDFNSESQYSLGLSSNFTDLNSQGAELQINLEMGTDKRMEAELYSPFFSSQTLFTTLSGHYSDEKRIVPADPGSVTSSDYFPVNYREWRGEWAVGLQRNLWSELRFGLRFTRGDGRFSTLPSLGDIEYDRKAVFGRYRIDTLDSFSLPTKGNYLNLQYLVSEDNRVIHEDEGDQEESDTAHEISAKLIGARSYQRHTLVANVDLGIVESKNSSVPIDPRELGGFLHLSGIPRNSLIGSNKFFSSLVYRYRWFDNDFGLFTSPVYLGASVEYGGVWSKNDLSLSRAPLYYAGSVFAGVDSPIGPIMFGYGRTEHHLDSFYLIVGTTYK
ncbi:patatin-like phospholipase family protein [Vibrio sp.]|uniref:patatin-like phospholipase family protein n=1 Tax=Vibrio sp. TaxID=678 RepID=UPI003D0DDB09